MNEKLLQRKKKILHNPITAFQKLYGKENGQQVDKLQEIWKRYQEEQTHRQTCQNEAKLISREIGKAKRNGKAIDDLKHKMQIESNRKKAINKNLQVLETQILSFFTPEDTRREDTETKSTPPKCDHVGRRYPDVDYNASQITVSLLDSHNPEINARWNQYVDKRPAASIYHRTEWRSLINGTFGHQSYYLYAEDTENNIKGILPLIRLKSHLFGDFLVSMPYFNYGGAVGDNADIEQLLIDAGNAQAEELGVDYIEYRDDIPRSDLPVRTDKTNMILSLPDNEDELWRSFKPKLRAQIKRPQRENPKIIIGKGDLLDDFYRVFSHNMRDLGTPVYGKSFFSAILHTFPDQCFLCIIRLSGKSVAGGFLIGFRGTLEIPWASTIKSVNHLSVNMLMYWEILRFAIRNGYSNFDFGRSSQSGGTYRFKKQWGAIPKPLYWHYWLKESMAVPSLNPNNPKYALMIAVWKKLPISLTQLIGPMIIKYLP